MRLFTLPNIILGREAIREKLALHFTVDEVAEELSRLLHDEAYRQRMLTDYAEIARLLGDTPAPVNAAKIIVQNISNQHEVTNT
jgi:lipid-A-disaccharide synthase